MGLWECYICVIIVFQICNRGVTGVLQGCYKGVIWVLRVAIGGLLGVLNSCYRDVTNV